MKVIGYATTSPGKRLEPFSYELGKLSSHEVRIQISHCGICHSDVHLIDNDWQISKYPLVPGHEVIGIVSEMGTEVSTLRIGDRVGVGWQCGSCLECEYCVKGDENLCQDSSSTCVGRYGGFSEMLQTDSRFAFKIPDGLESDSAAPLLCGGITVYSPLRHFGVLPGMHVGVVGIGGLGHLAVQFARNFGCRVTAFSTTKSKEEEALALGAHAFIPSNDLDELAHAAYTLDFILVTANATLDWESYVRALKPNGKLCFVGAAPDNLTVSIMELLSKRKSICGSPIGGRHTIREMLSFAANNDIYAKTEVLPMSEVNTALDKVRANKARYRMVLKN